MFVSYLLVFILATIFFYCLFVKSNRTFSWSNLSDVVWNAIVGPSLFAAFTCLFCYAFSSSVYEIKDNKKYSKNDYILFYKDFNDDYHILIPFTNYLANESSKELKIYPVYYGYNIEKNKKESYYKSKGFYKLENKEYYVFQTPPEFVRVKNKSGEVRFVIDYVE